MNGLRLPRNPGPWLFRPVAPPRRSQQAHRSEPVSPARSPPAGALTKVGTRRAARPGGGQDAGDLRKRFRPTVEVEARQRATGSTRSRASRTDRARLRHHRGVSGGGRDAPRRHGQEQSDPPHCLRSGRGAPSVRRPTGEPGAGSRCVRVSQCERVRTYDRVRPKSRTARGVGSTAQEPRRASRATAEATRSSVAVSATRTCWAPAVP